MKRLTHSVDETIALGKRLGETLASGAVLCLHGDLGAGKTHLIKGIVHGATQVPPEEVCSPTFVYLGIYRGAKTVYHFDLYRLGDEDEFLSMGFDEYFGSGICCIEWPERIAGILPAGAIHVTLEHRGEQLRQLTGIEEILP